MTTKIASLPIEQQNTIKKLINTLTLIDMQKPVFFNVAQYEKLGLVISKKKWGTDAVGNKIVTGHTFHLTSKAKQFINVII